jgi:hypothetical protein
MEGQVNGQQRLAVKSELTRWPVKSIDRLSGSHRHLAVTSGYCLLARLSQSNYSRERFAAWPEIDSFVTAAALRYPACWTLHLEAP